MKVEPQALEACPVGMEVEEEYDVSAGDAFRKRALGEKQEEMVVSRSAWCEQRWKKRRATAKTGSP